MNSEENNAAISRDCDEGIRKAEKIVPILYTTREAAAFCMISESNWYKLNRNGYVPKPVRIGTMYRWRKGDLVEWVQAGCPKNWQGEK